MNAQAFFTQQSPITDPGDYRHRYDDIPDDIIGIVRTVQGLIRHYSTPGYATPVERLREIDLRYIPAILRRILELDNRPLTEARAIPQRFVGCCRDYTVLAASILRHKGIPARARYGGAAYFDKGHFHDHAILEYWNGMRWTGVDVQLDEASMRRHGIKINPFDVTHEQFIRGGRGWLMCRHEEVNPYRFGLGAKSPLRGMHFTLGELVLDLAALNRQEMLCWDTWGYSGMFDSLTDADKTLLDRVAESTLDESQFEQWQRDFQHESLTLPDVILSSSPALTPAEMPARVKVK